MTGTTNNATPLWLEMRPEYIDANFERLSDYLRKNANEVKDSFHTETLHLLHLRVEQYVSGLSAQPLSVLDKCQKSDSLQKESLAFGIKLLGVFLLTSEPTADRDIRVKAYLCQQLLLAQLCSDNLQKSIVEKALDTALCGEVRNIGYSWTDLLNDSPDILANKIMRSGMCLPHDADVWLEELGSACMAKGRLRLMACNKRESDKRALGASLSVAEGRVEVLSSQSGKLRQSKQDDIDSVMRFANDYIRDLKKVEPSVNVLREYHVSSEDAVRVRVTDKTFDRIIAVSTDRMYKPLHGIVRMNNVLCCNFRDCLRSFKVGDEFPARYVGNENGNAVFEIDGEFVKYVVECVFETGKEVLARAERTTKGTTMWITEFGVPVYTQNDAHEDGEWAILSITRMNDNGYVYAQYQCDTDEYFDPAVARKQTLEYFCYEPSESEGVPEPQKISILDRQTLAGVTRALYLLQKSLPLPRERYRILCVIAILCKMTEDEPSFQMVDFVTQYIRNTVYFAQGEYAKISELMPGELIKGEISTDRRISIIKILRNYASLTEPDFLENMAQNDDEFLSKIAQLVQTSNRMKDLLDAPLLNAITREITKMLSLEDESTTGLEKENGIYLGTEDLHKEFKTSIVYPPENGMQPNLQKQKVNVFKGVCAFLNSTTGGTLYLGVNDLGYVVGIEQDMNYLNKNTIDEYVRFINDEVKAAFGLDLLHYIQIHPMYENRVVAIEVASSEYKIAKLNNVAYIRTNAESREMDDETAAQMLSRKLHFDKDKAFKEHALGSAIEGKLKVILHGYRSNNSDDCRDRKVEPISFDRGYKHVWCYECDSHLNKMFSIARIGNVEILDEPWTNTLNHSELKSDLFHMTGTDTYHVILQLDNMARNLLVEEFEGSEKELTDNKNGTWTLDTEVYRLEGIGRFYIGLAKNITILQSDELKEYVRKYMQDIVV